MKNKTLSLLLLMSLSVVSCSENKVQENKQTYVVAEEKSSEKVTSKNTGSAYFKFNSAVLSTKCKHNSGVLALAIKNIESLGNQVTNVQITGHADERGSDKYNMELSHKRALAVAKYIKEKTGINVETFAEGKRNPIVKNAKTEDQHRQNRRVVVIVNFVE